MDFEEKLNAIVMIILKKAKKYGVKVVKILLFGSRARGDYNPDSDWDILVVTDKKINKTLKKKFVAEAKREIVWTIDDPVDIIVVDSKHFEEYKNIYGDISGIANLEGKTIYSAHQGFLQI